MTKPIERTSDLCLNSGDDVYICTGENNIIEYLGKEVPEDYKNKISGALVGISKYSEEFLNKLFINQFKRIEFIQSNRKSDSL